MAFAPESGNFKPSFSPSGTPVSASGVSPVSAFRTESTSPPTDWGTLDSTSQSPKPAYVSFEKGSDSDSGSSPNPATAPDGFYVDRVATSEQVVLSANAYAEVLRSFFSSAGTGELCFALLGHWGRGKTFLMRLLAPKLESNGYQTVFFSAWKYPNVPEVWVHLYETIADAALAGPFLVTLPRRIQIGIVKNGYWPLVLALVPLIILAITQTGFIHGLEAFADYILSFIGIGGIVWLLHAGTAIWRTKLRLTKNFLTVSRHRTELGLQAVIGDDLKVLLKGWIPKYERAGAVTRGTLMGLSNLLFFVVVWRTCENYGVIVEPTRGEFWLTFLGFLIATSLVFYLYGCMTWRQYPTRRLLLVIDDLDRCTPTQLLTVVESIKLLLEDPEFSERIQLAMLVEEDVLRHAITEKYKSFLNRPIEKRGKESNDDSRSEEDVCINRERRLQTDSFEKLFTAHLRLLHLETPDVSAVVKGIVSRNNSVARQENRSSIVVACRTRLEIGLMGLDRFLRVRTLQPIARPVEFFTPEEAQTLIGMIPSLVDENDPQGSPLSWGPRSIRNFIFRYQLARLILNKLDKPCYPKEVANALVNAAVRSEDHHVDIPREVEQVAAQVS